MVAMEEREKPMKLYHLAFNQENTCLAAGTLINRKELLVSDIRTTGTCKGFRVYQTHPFVQYVYEGKGGMGIVEMLHCSSLVALVGAGEKPAFSPRR